MQYLVMLIHSNDDVPIRLFSDPTEAREFAKHLHWRPTEEIRELFHVDCTTPAGVRIIQFDERGVPNRVFMRCFDEDCDTIAEAEEAGKSTKAKSLEDWDEKPATT